MDLIVGTAGHIDHGKTSLVKALTGVDADRLPEEKQRGITIDIGFAELNLGEVHIGFVDVPGHERFIKNMLAGASGIDGVLLVVAADEGVMPQTREHFEICRLLGTKGGVIALTKSDLVDKETVQLVTAEVAELTKDSFLEDAPRIPVSAITGEGIEDLKSALKRVARGVPERHAGLVTRLPIDRSFSIKGFGAVVTGTLIGGAFRESDELDLLPSGTAVRVRGIQSHGQSVTVAKVGMRTAVNLGGIDHHQVSRGMVLAEKGCLCTSQMLDAKVEVLAGSSSPIRSRQRVRVHLGTAELLARIEILDEAGSLEPGKSGFVQLRFEAPVIAVPEERFIIRRYSPQETVAGGIVIDNLASKHRTKEYEKVSSQLEALLDGNTEERFLFYLEREGERGCDLKRLINKSGLNMEAVRKSIAKLVSDGEVVESDEIYMSSAAFDRLKRRALKAIEGHHASEPLSKGIQLATLKEKVFAGTSPQIFKRVLASLSDEMKVSQVNDAVSSGSRTMLLSPAELTLKNFFSKTIRDCGLEVPKLGDVLKDGIAISGLSPDQVRKIFQLLIDSKEIVKISDDFFFGKEAIDDLIFKLREFAEKSSDRLVDVPGFKDIARVSRKFAIPILEYLDREKVTRRAGDKRYII